MTELDTNQEQPVPGDILKKRRQQKGLSTQDIASQLRLDPNIVEALEANNFEALPAATYIRGYIRSYAKLLGVDGDEIVALYDDRAVEPPEIIPDVKHPTQVSSSDKPVKAFTYLVSFILVLLLLTWWWQKYFISQEQSPVPKHEENQISTPATEKEQTVLPEYNEDETVTLPEEILTESTQALQEAPSLVSETSIDFANEPEIEQPSINESADNSLTLAADDRLEIPTGPDTLFLTVNADSWIEIYDAYNNKLYLDLARTGDEIVINGAAPFDVKLGFSQGVQVLFNGEPFDAAPYSRLGVARFTLGE